MIPVSIYSEYFPNSPIFSLHLLSEKKNARINQRLERLIIISISYYLISYADFLLLTDGLPEGTCLWIKRVLLLSIHV